jgi:hypothetical protein
MISSVNLMTCRTRITRIVHTESRRHGAVKRFGELPRRKMFAHTGRAGKQIGVSKAFVREGIGQ